MTSSAMALYTRLLPVLVYLCWPFLRLARLLYDTVVHAIFALFFRFRAQKTKLPPVFSPTLLLSATQLAKAIRERKMSSVSVVRAYISRISDVNPLLNALAQEVFKEALQDALRVDERIAKGYKDGTLTPEYLAREEPFLGVPFTIKESIAVAGLYHTGGLISRRFTIASRDAAVVQVMRKAGAILLATTNVSELGMWWETENRLYGTTCNPYDLNRTPGGSSGGECSLMCACGTPLSLGSDVGGSLRTPAFFCGLFSHKPTPGYISVSGVGVHPASHSNTLHVAGPFMRHAEDLLPLLRLLCTEGDTARLALDKPINLAQVRVFSIADDGGGGVVTSPVCRTLRAAQDAVCRHFRDTHDITVVKVWMPALQRAYCVWREKMTEESVDLPDLRQQLADNKGSINVWTEVVRAVLGRANHTWPSLVQAVGEQLLGSEGGVASNTGHPQWRSLLGKLQRLLGTTGVLLYPSHPTLAPYHRESLLLPFNFVYTAVFNALGLPVTQVPLGLTSDGLPIGIQVVGGMHMDRLTVAVAEDLEKAFGGWRCPAEIL